MHKENEKQHQQTNWGGENQPPKSLLFTINYTICINQLSSTSCAVRFTSGKFDELNFKF